MKHEHHSENEQCGIMAQQSEYEDMNPRRSIFASPESEPPCAMLRAIKRGDDQTSSEWKLKCCEMSESVEDHPDHSVPETERRKQWNAIASLAFEQAANQNSITSF